MLTQLIFFLSIDFISVNIDFIFYWCRGWGQPIEFHLDKKSFAFFSCFCRIWSVCILDCWCGLLFLYCLLLMCWYGAFLFPWLGQKFVLGMPFLSQCKREYAFILWLLGVGYVDIAGILPKRWFAILVFMPMDLSSESEEDASVAASDNLRILNSSLEKIS